VPRTNFRLRALKREGEREGGKEGRGRETERYDPGIISAPIATVYKRCLLPGVTDNVVF